MQKMFVKCIYWSQDRWESSQKRYSACVQLVDIMTIPGHIIVMMTYGVQREILHWIIGNVYRQVILNLIHCNDILLAIQNMEIYTVYIRHLAWLLHIKYDSFDYSLYAYVFNCFKLVVSLCSIYFSNNSYQIS
ncbi:MAG: hypothetical protein ACD_3C00086G0046 [uncultured bacterium (gcode 4)]|uniref:Uncharacterized protein n=1 Tax=uncultured bacterium (gcode 4) TaxID=1234023 RepID=K2G1U6_9BACT|nr:MAG: hypothetical protein ACD_3C00086G0046 [uncultured bacterium (gcode 4)]